jgi:general secretion pathway protein I
VPPVRSSLPSPCLSPPRSAEPNHERHDRGFTLVELLVALAIFAIAIGFAYRALSGALASQDGSERNQMAVRLAQTMLDRVGRDIALNPGDMNGRTQDGSIWQLRMTPDSTAAADATTSPANCITAPVLQGIVVQISVGWTEQQHPHQIRLSSLRLVQIPCK